MREQIRERIDDVCRQLCMDSSASCITLKDDAIDWMTNWYIDTYCAAGNADDFRMPDIDRVIKAMIEYIQEH